MSNKRQEDVSTVLVYVRYLLPIALCVALLATIFIPCLSYSTVEGPQSEISEAELLRNSWVEVRDYLFATSEREASQESFSWTVLILLPVLVLLFLIGLLSTVIVAIVALIYINRAEFERSDARIWFISVIPNRIVACALHALTLPLLFYPRLIIPLYDRIMNVDVSLSVSGAEPWLWGLIAMAVIIALSAVSAHYEKKLDVDPFKKPIPPVVRVVDPDEYDGEDGGEPAFKTEDERKYYDQQKRARAEQAELIRRLLNKNDEKEK